MFQNFWYLYLVVINYGIRRFHFTSFFFPDNFTKKIDILTPQKTREKMTRNVLEFLNFAEFTKKNIQIFASTKSREMALFDKVKESCFLFRLVIGCSLPLVKTPLTPCSGRPPKGTAGKGSTWWPSPITPCGLQSMYFATLFWSCCKRQRSTLPSTLPIKPCSPL